MSIQMTLGDDTTVRSPHQPIVLYDDTDGMAFGPTFDDRREAQAFVRWFERPQPSDGRVIEVRHLKRYLPDEQKAVAAEWRTLLMDHGPEVCPFDDRESYGVGYTGDSDHGDEARPDACDCPCHES